MNAPLAYTVKDVAARTPRGIDSVYKAVESGALTATQTHKGATWCITPKALEAWVAAGCPIYPLPQHGRRAS